MKKKRNKIDWESIEKEYRAGQLSIREIARQHSCSDAAIHKKAKLKGWERDLTKRIQQRVSTKLVSEEVSDANANQNENEIIEEMANRNVAAIKLMRQDIENLRVIEQRYINELNGEPKKLWIGQYKGEIVEKEVSLTVTERAIAAANLANVQHKRIALERQARNIDQKSPTGSEDDPFYVKHGMDTKGLQKAMAPKRVEPPMIEGGE
jgi:hypothetical protein